MKKYCAVIFSIAILAPGASRVEELPPPEQNAINRISADALRGNLSFLASDALEGRMTPSHGLDVAAEFIASQFRRARLDPVAPGGSYFQSAKFADVTPRLDEFRLTLDAGGEELELNREDARVRSLVALDLKDAPVVKLPSSGALPAMEGKIVAGESQKYGTEAALETLQSRRPALILLMSRRQRPRAPDSYITDTESSLAPVIRIYNEDAASELGAKPEMTVSVHLPAPARKDAVIENVAGILRGSDPLLRDQYVILTAHYDHLGMLSSGSGDRIYNGANDNASGAVSVIEIAAALGTLNPHPKRSILFMALFGEEEGLLGAYYYTHHPLVPLKNTVADINLEQMGRTDEKEGKQVNAFAFTGPSYSNLPAIMSEAAKAEGVKTWSRNDADSFFERSDNYAFALAGIVAHTIAVAFDFPDYHALADEWQKIDYANMAKVDKGVAAGLLRLANGDDTPHWSDRKEAARYREAVK